MDNKKPMKDWTLYEMKQYCSVTGCRECAARNEYVGWCLFESGFPCDWRLETTPRWTKNDIGDARAIKRVCPDAVEVKRDDTSGNCVVLVPDRGSLVFEHPDLFPSLKFGESATLQEILDADTIRK